MKLSVGIPAYNRPSELSEALDSICPQCTSDVEVVVCEDYSPRRAEIEKVVADALIKYPSVRLNYFCNAENLGYDGNLRSILDRASGEYVFFMGDDDRVASGAIAKILEVVRDGSVGVVLRAWRSYDKTTQAILDSHHYFSGDRLFPAGTASVAAFFRRSVFISGLTINRQAARSVHTAEFDGLLLYQLYLVGKLLRKMPGYYIDSIVTERRVGGEHFFGSSSREAGRFEPNKLEIDHSVRFLSGLFRIAEHLRQEDSAVYDAIRKDLGRYSYPMLEIQAVKQSRRTFAQYGLKLADLGMRPSVFFWIYFVGLLLLGPRVCGKLIAMILRVHGSTPVLSGSVGVSPTERNLG